MKQTSTDATQADAPDARRAARDQFACRVARRLGLRLRIEPRPGSNGGPRWTICSQRSGAVLLAYYPRTRLGFAGELKATGGWRAALRFAADIDASGRLDAQAGEQLAREPTANRVE
jgi:hypothetical protein